MTMSNANAIGNGNDMPELVTLKWSWELHFNYFSDFYTLQITALCLVFDFDNVVVASFD